jgi:hypothetical protein
MVQRVVPCCASSPCGVCIVARCPFSVGEERERRADMSNFCCLPAEPGELPCWFRIDYRSTAGPADLGRLAKDLVQLAPDVIVVQGTPMW